MCGVLLTLWLKLLFQFFREAEGRLVEDFRVTYLNPHISAMVHEERTIDLTNLFLLLRPLPHALEPLVAEFGQHVKSQGECITCTVALW